MAFKTVAEIALILGITEADIPASIITWAQSQVEKMLSKNYTAVEGATKEFLLRDVPQSYLDLPHTDVVVSTIKYRANQADTEETTIDADDYYIDEENGLILFDYELYRTYIYKVTYDYGGDTIEDIDVYLHFLLVFKYLLKFKSNLFADNVTVVSEKIGDYSIKYNVDVFSRPEMIEQDIQAIIKIAGAGDGTFVGLI